ncbi:MAG: cation diffusion facilitator family transporter [Lachnospiraceae bacterium]|nr:cation diffusion facilitator family transporter [Lachnospiraceae bacterium]
MITVLAKLFIKDYKNTEEAGVRRAYGVLCGVVGIILNLVLFSVKIFAGMISTSAAIVTDAFNNLSDALSSLIMMVGFKMSGHDPDPEHPFGHGRIEYVTGLIVSFLIILMGVELFKNAIEHIIHPSPVSFEPVTVVILIVSILTKLYMYFYNKRTGEKITSAAMQATAMDSFSDSAATCAVLFAMMIGEFTGVMVDGWCALVVSLFILYTGITSAKDTVQPLLGSAPDKEFVDKIEAFAMSYPEILGIHDLIVHDYGPGRMMISFHAEVPANGDILELHDVIDRVEQKLRDVLKCDAVIHMDPVAVDDEETNRMKAVVLVIVKGIDDRISMHDFRMVQGPTHTNLIFDVVVPYDCSRSDEEVKSAITEQVRSLSGNYFAVIQVDKPFV